MQYNFIAVEGNIGAGKTSLAKKLHEDLGGDLVCEKFDLPELTEFYAVQRNARKNETQRHDTLMLELTFMVERHDQLQSLTTASRSEGPIIADYFIEKCLVFGRATLTQPEFALYSRLFRIVQTGLPRPDILLFLQADAPDLQHRIRLRKRPNEQSIETTYLEGIQAGYKAHRESWRDIPVLIIDTAEMNFVANDSDYRKILNALSIRHEPGATTSVR